MDISLHGPLIDAGLDGGFDGGLDGGTDAGLTDAGIDGSVDPPVDGPPLVGVDDDRYDQRSFYACGAGNSRSTLVLPLAALLVALGRRRRHSPRSTP